MKHKRLFVALIVALLVLLAYVPAASAAERIRVPGSESQKKLVHKVTPVYPPEAKEARIQGTVRLEAVISKEGDVAELSVVSGHPKLVQAALDAVKQWRYEPTYLNGQPVEVITTIDVNFVLSPEK